MEKILPKDYLRAWKKKNADKIKSYNIKYYASHKEQVAGYQKKYRKKNNAKLNAQLHENYLKNREQRIKYATEYKRRKRAEEKLKKI